MTPRRRPLLWLAGLVGYTLLLVPTGTLLLAFMIMPPWSDEGPSAWLEGFMEMITEKDWWAWAVPSCAVIVVTQFAFVAPVVRLRPPQGTRPRSLTVSLVIGGLVSTLLSMALGLALIELAASFWVGDLSVNPWGNNDLLGQLWTGTGLLVMLIGSWVFWSMLLLVFSRNLWPDTVLGRLVVLLFGGTIVELLVVVPVDIMVRRRTDCYCATGTFFSLVFSAIALMWLTGPGIVIAVTAKRRRLARRTHCGKCGQAKGPSPGPACPECGYAWQGPA